VPEESPMKASTDFSSETGKKGTGSGEPAGNVAQLF
jgi:hypothetical protein